MGTVWRSWFWNIVGATILFFMTLIATWVAFTTQPLTSNIVFGLMAVVMWIGVYRTLFRGVTAKAHGIVVSDVTHTITIPWEDIADITDGGQAPGPSGAIGATVPVVILKEGISRGFLRKGRVELSMLARYGSGQILTPADDAIPDLKAHLERWRHHQSSKSEDQA